jgi:hypothetical protein
MSQPQFLTSYAPLSKSGYTHSLTVSQKLHFQIIASNWKENRNASSAKSYMMTSTQAEPTTDNMASYLVPCHVFESQRHLHLVHIDLPAPWQNGYQNLSPLAISLSFWALQEKQQTKQTPWPGSLSELYWPSDRRLSAKLMPTFEDRGWNVVRVKDPYGRNLGFINGIKLCRIFPNFSDQHFGLLMRKASIIFRVSTFNTSHVFLVNFQGHQHNTNQHKWFLNTFLWYFVIYKYFPAFNPHSSLSGHQYSYLGVSILFFY